MTIALRDFCYEASRRVMAGLEQEIGIRPNFNYYPRGYNSARVLTLKLNGINPTYLPGVRRLRDELTMWAGLSDKAKIRIGWSGTTILIEIPKPPRYWQQVTIEKLEQRRMMRRGPVVTLGLGLQDDPKRINFKEPAIAHVFITGQTRSGKTNTQRLIGWNLARSTSPQDAQLLIFDAAKRGHNWRDFANVPHLAHPIVTDIPEAEQVMAWLSAEVDRRAMHDYTQPRLFCLIDELKALIDDSPAAISYLSRLAAIGGEFGIHLILATQYPQIKMLGSAELKRNITTRLCGKVDDAAAASNALGLTNSGAETLQGYGDFLMRDFDGLSRLTVAHLQNNHVAQLPRSEPRQLSLAPVDGGHNGAGPPSGSQQTDCITPEEIAPVLFQWGADHRTGIGKIQKQIRARYGLGVGTQKAERIQQFIISLIELAQADGVKTVPFDQLATQTRQAYHQTKRGY